MSAPGRSDETDIRIKILTIGDSGVGKRQLIDRYVGEATPSASTVGIDFRVKTLTIADKTVKLQIWDTAGQERFRTLTTSYFRGTQAILLVYDVTDRASFDGILTFAQEVDKHTDASVCKMLIGNKCDLESSRVVSKAEGEALAKQLNVPFFETSPKDNVNITEAFTELTRLAVARQGLAVGPEKVPAEKPSTSAAAAAGRPQPFDTQVKIITIGDSGVEKGALILRFAEGTFSPSFITTIGIDFKVKTVTIGDNRVKLQIWDTAGQERFRTITTSYFRGAQGILLVYDVTDRTSFDSILTWIKEVEKYADMSVCKMLIGNKCHLESERVVSQEEGKALAKRFNMPFFETSAQKDINVTEAFTELARLVVERQAANGGQVAAGGPSVTLGGATAVQDNSCSC